MRSKFTTIWIPLKQIIRIPPLPLHNAIKSIIGFNGGMSDNINCEQTRSEGPHRCERKFALVIINRCLDVTVQIILIDFDVGPNSMVNYWIGPNKIHDQFHAEHLTGYKIFIHS
jgi:hypothetical protein